ncbi:MAG: PCP reductase family protein [Thermodesulfobacteriota bacterium]|nr:PCP reductase family protein [Thermodesulfobacteriota bacterium]
MHQVMWEKDAEKALSKVPFFVRSMVWKKVEQGVGNTGGRRVPLADFWARTKDEEIYSELFRASKNIKLKDERGC